MQFSSYALHNRYGNNMTRASIEMCLHGDSTRNTRYYCPDNTVIMPNCHITVYRACMYGVRNFRIVIACRKLVKLIVRKCRRKNSITMAHKSRRINRISTRCA